MVEAAALLGIQDRVGSVAVGKAADLVILDGDPLADIRNTRKIWMVVKGGQVVR
jgi:imidazolonepropionase-like amidohydrolase